MNLASDVQFATRKLAEVRRDLAAIEFLDAPEDAAKANQLREYETAWLEVIHDLSRRACRDHECEGA